MVVGYKPDTSWIGLMYRKGVTRTGNQDVGNYELRTKCLTAGLDPEKVGAAARRAGCLKVAVWLDKGNYRAVVDAAGASS